jgi:hypothetical protein|tara:strand:- start:548 stop:832 length:285 start_codon:yes stop_codon:yes gene_type:complete
MRISEKHLQSLVDRLNEIMGQNPKPYNTTKTENRANVGTYLLDAAYGGWQLAQICNENGGQDLPLGGGFESKRATYEKIRAFIRGIEAAREVKK